MNLNEQELTIKVSTVIPEGHTVETLLRKEAVDTLYALRVSESNDPDYSGADLDEEVGQLLEEVEAVCNKGLAGYLLAVASFSKQNRLAGLPEIGTGGSLKEIPLLAYYLGLSGVNPNG